MDLFLNTLVAGILLGGIFSLVSIGLNIIFGVVGVVNFAQGVLVVIAMYGSYYLHEAIGISPYVALCIVTPVLFVIGVLIQRGVIQPLLREEMMQIFATFGLLIVGQSVLTTITGGVGKSVRTAAADTVLHVGPVSMDLGRIIVLAAATVVAIGLVLFLNRTLLGTSIRAVNQDQEAARLMGIRVERTYLIAFGLGSALAGLAGALLTPLYTITPDIGFTFILPAFVVVVLGGLGSVGGAYAGGIIVGLVEAFAGTYVDPVLDQAFAFILFLLVLVFKPTGLTGASRRAATTRA